MKLYVLLVLCIAVVNGEKKINLEDIERDNLQAEAQSDEDNVPVENTKYDSDKTAEDDSKSQYQTESRFGGQQAQDIKYVPQIQQATYTPDLQAYQQQQQQHVPQQYYIPNYQSEEAAYSSEKSSPQISYHPQLTQGLSYQSEIPVGNQIQSYQQKVATQKFSSGLEKAPHYNNVAASGNQQVLYYPTPSVAPIEKSQVQPALLHQLATHAAQNVKLPAYPSVNYEPKVSYQLEPQIRYVYEPQYVQVASPTYSSKSTQKYTYSAPAAAPQTYSSSPQTYSGLTYSQQSSHYSQPKSQYTQAYYIQPQFTQYYQEPAYISSPHRNSLSYSQSQPLYFPANLVQQLSPRYNLEQQNSHGSSQNYAKIPEEPRYTLTAPQIPAHSFRTSPITQLRPLHSSNHVYYSSGVKSLLDSYTPSSVIAAADRERYRERPLHLEGGFLPSKGSYAHSYNQKRKAE